ncbi:O-antigen ligase family protein [Sutcliffiella cohnii]|uniref:O-antigen ligase family protein n=1 Tax=Sutcliffiella cohnii TaxID=33932 RepID=UPI002E1D957F|nr:O-antigen ligase family protein [Sutcliffiella cohnii]
MDNKKIDLNAIMLAIYIWMFIVLRVIWVYNADYSTIILGGLAFIMICISIIFNRNFISKTFLVGLVLINILIIALLLDILFRNNGVISTRLYEFFIYGVIPIVLMSKVKNFKNFFQVYILLSIVVFFIYFLDPFNDFLISTSYMVFGFQVMLPAFLGFHIGRIEFKYKYFIIFEVITFWLILFFGNRMAAIACISFLIIIDIFYRNKSYKKILKYVLILLLSIITIINLESILENVSNYLEGKGLSSYTIRSTLYYLNGTIDSYSAGRNILWENAIEMIKNNPIIGWGVGYYESIYNIYVHNFILEILLSYGMIGFVFFILLIMNSIIQIVKSEKYLKLFGLIIFCISFPKLFTSIYIFIEPTFWLFIFYGLFAPIYRKQNQVSIRKA